MNRFTKAKKHEVEVKVEKLQKHICGVTEGSKWEPIGHGEITVDSAAEESVCPKKWGDAYEMRRPSRWMKFVNASRRPSKLGWSRES